MNKIFKKTTALFSAAVMTVCGSMGCFPTVFAEGGEGGKEVEVIFDFVPITEKTANCQVLTTTVHLLPQQVPLLQFHLANSLQTLTDLRAGQLTVSMDMRVAKHIVFLRIMQKIQSFSRLSGTIMPKKILLM